MSQKGIAPSLRAVGAGVDFQQPEPASVVMPRCPYPLVDRNAAFRQACSTLIGVMWNSLFSSFLLAVWIFSASEALASGVVFNDGFESGAIELTLWNPQVYDHVDGATIVTASSGGPVRSGEYAVRMKLAVTDPLDPGGKHRSELRPRSKPNELSYQAPFGLAMVYELSIQLPADWQPDGPEIVAQWHGKVDRDGSGIQTEPHRSPPLALRMTFVESPPTSGTFVPAWNIVSHWDANETTSSDLSSVTTVTVLDPVDATADLGQWVDWRFEVTWDWDPDGDGHVRVLKDGFEIATYDGPNAFNDAEGPNSKIGLYKWNWPTDEVNLRVAYYDDVRIFIESTALPALGPTGGAAAILVLGAAGVLWTARRT